MIGFDICEGYLKSKCSTKFLDYFLQNSKENISLFDCLFDTLYNEDNKNDDSEKEKLKYKF